MARRYLKIAEFFEPVVEGAYCAETRMTVPRAMCLGQESLNVTARNDQRVSAQWKELTQRVANPNLAVDCEAALPLAGSDESFEPICWKSCRADGSALGKQTLYR